jgi:pimeloyl-ACP methyl ester carboxylesterase
MRLATLAWPFPFLVSLGWATARTPNPDPLKSVGRVYLLRGQGIVFSRGFGAMCSALRRAGWWAEDLRCVGHTWAFRHLRGENCGGSEKRQTGKMAPPGPVVLVGHSCGGRSALELAGWLETLEIAVRLVICVDVAWAQRVPANVERAIHLYRGSNRIYPASPLQLAQIRNPQSAIRNSAEIRNSSVENIALDAPDSPLHEPGLNHLNITARPAIQKWIVGRILESNTRSCLA